MNAVVEQPAEAFTAMIGDTAIALVGCRVAIEKNLESGVFRITAGERPLLGALLLGLGRVVTRKELEHAGWPNGATPSNVMEVQIGRLRAKLKDYGITIDCVRGVGYQIRGVT